MTDAAAEPAVNQTQLDYWNTLAGQVWARFQAQLDRQLEPLGQAAMATLAPRAGERLLDIGCGCGATTLDLAVRVAPGGEVLAVDISAPMLEIARHRPRPSAGLAVSFRQADAQTADLGTGAFDGAFSRFGVMFFADPAAAFTNIRGALRRGGRLAFVCWRPLAENPWMGEPLAAARPLLPPMAPPDPLAPGPFAFADPERLRDLLAAAGFTAIAVKPFDTRIGGGDLEATLELALNVGPLAAALRENPDRRGPVSEAVRAAMASYLTAAGVMAPAAVWIVQAVNP